jgi:ubiquinone biosynthesis protein COQ4
MVAALGEATATPFFINKLRDTMLSDSAGRRILRERPRITSTTLDVEKLRLLPDNTLGREYVRWLEIEGVSPDTRAAVPPHNVLSDIGPLHRRPGTCVRDATIS